MGSFAAQQYLLDHAAQVDGVVLTGTAVIDLLEPALDLDQPLDLTMFNAPFQPARTDYDWLTRDEAVRTRLRRRSALRLRDRPWACRRIPAGARRLVLSTRARYAAMRFDPAGS